MDSIIDLCIGHWAEIVQIDPRLRDRLIEHGCANDVQYGMREGIAQAEPNSEADSPEATKEHREALAAETDDD